MTPDELPQHHIRNAIQVLDLLPRDGLGRRMLQAEDYRDIRARLQRAVHQLEIVTDARANGAL
jgi:hypothetical protein